jgi:hypothetical protein
MPKQGNVFEQLYISYEDLSREIGVTIDNKSVIEINTFTDNTIVSFERKDNGIVFYGKEKYDIRNEWVPKIKSGYYNIGKEIKFYNPDMNGVKLKDVHPCSITGVLKTDGPYGAMGHKNKNLNNEVVNGDYSSFDNGYYFIYEENF